MELIKGEYTISKIVLAICLKSGKGTPVHKDRPSHGLAFNEVGTSVYTFDTGEELTCHSGECIYLPKGSNYTVRRGSDVKTDIANDSIYAINFQTIPERDNLHPFLLRVRGKDEMLSYFSRAANAWQRKDVGFVEECTADLYRIIRLIKRELARYSPERRSLELIAPAIKYMNENYTKENITVSHLSALCGVSEPYLRRLFNNAFSISPAVYMRNLRIKYAKELLSSGDCSVTDAAVLSGFNDPAYFSREFKKAVGVTPSEYCEGD